MSAQPNVIELPNVPVERMAAELLRALVDEVRLAPAQWSKLSESQQEGVINRLRAVVRVETEKAMQLIAKGKQEAARVKVESLTAKEGVKCVLTLAADSAHAVLDYVGKPAVLVMCNPEQFFSGANDVKADKDQQDLPLGGAPADGDAPAEGDPIGEVEAEDAEERLAIDVDDASDVDQDDKA